MDFKQQRVLNDVIYILWNTFYYFRCVLFLSHWITSSDIRKSVSNKITGGVKQKEELMFRVDSCGLINSISYKKGLLNLFIIIMAFRSVFIYLKALFNTCNTSLSIIVEGPKFLIMVVNSGLYLYVNYQCCRCIPFIVTKATVKTFVEIVFSFVVSFISRRSFQSKNLEDGLKKCQQSSITFLENFSIYHFYCLYVRKPVLKVGLKYIYLCYNINKYT